MENGIRELQEDDLADMALVEKGPTMALKDVLPQLRKERGMTQEDLAAKLYITRQAVSRWETGETTPGIDMIKLIAVTLDVPVVHLIDMPEHYCQSCGMILSDASECGSNEDGSANPDYCKWCYEDGGYVDQKTMEQMIEECAPMMAEHLGWSVDQCASLMGAVLPNLTRWK